MMRERRGGRQSLPDYLIIGAPKAGTTSLAAYLDAHPQVFVAPVKEVRFFDDDGRYARGLDWYRRQFAADGSPRRRGEATPTYLASEAAPGRIARALPGVRLIAILRDPADRAYSMYNHVVGWGGERRSFDDIVRCYSALPGPDADDYMWGSRYLPQLRRYRDHFPPDQLKVVVLEDMQARPAEVFGDVCRFLGVDTFESPVVGGVHNASRRIRAPRVRQLMEAVWTWFPEPLMRWLDHLNSEPVVYPPMPMEARVRIDELFAAENAELAALFGLDLSAWGKAGR